VVLDTLCIPVLDGLLVDTLSTTGFGGPLVYSLCAPGLDGVLLDTLCTP
jgi:hypothetical protein